MTDYIKREDAIKWLKNLFDDCGNYMPLWHYGEVLPKIIELLEVDVAPVRPGKWKTYKGEVAGRGFFYCTKCHCNVYDVSNYCPNCGAKMDGERKDNEID